ncbi:MAG: HAD-IB family hydrolase [Ferruginibacter sp.]
MQKEIAFFDFDGTITRRDTMLALAMFHAGKPKFFFKMMLLSPSLVALKLKLITAQAAKEKFLTSFFGGMELAQFNELCRKFDDNILPSLIRKDALAKIEEHKKNAVSIVVVSASAENWLMPWARKNGLELICTKLEVKDHTITGKLDGINCNAKEKVSRIKAMFNLADFNTIYAYGDSAGDRDMLSIATHPGFGVFTL